MLKTEYSNNRV